MEDANTENAESTIPRLRDAQFRDLYANQIFVSMSPFDVSVTFSKNTEIAPGQQGLIDLANVTISPQQLKSVVRVLTDTLAAYENNFGRLSIDDSYIEPQLSKEELSELISESRAKNIEARKKAKASLKR